MSVYAGVKVGRVYKLSKTDLSIEAYSDDFREDPYGHVGKVVSDGDYIYADVQIRVFETPGDPGSPFQHIAKVFKLNKNTLTKITESATNYKIIQGMAMLDDGYIYIGAIPGVTGVGRVHKLNTSDLSEVTQSIQYTGNIWGIALDSDYVYIGRNEEDYPWDSRIWKLKQSDLSKVGQSALYSRDSGSIALDAEYLYFGSSVNEPADIIWKLSKSSLAKVYEKSGMGSSTNDLVFKDNFVYVAADDYVWKLKASDLSKVAENDAEGGAAPIIVDNEYNYIGVSSSVDVGRVWKLNNSDLSKVTESSNISAIYGLTFEEAYAPPPPPPPEQDYAFIT